jgi:hypothetical protein
MPRRDFSKVAFAATGDTNSIPTAVQPDGSVSLQQGFGFDYQRDNGAGGGTPDPLAKNIDREDVNGVFNEITASLGEIQQSGFPIWVASAAPYPINARVRHLDKVWKSAVTNNNSTPGADTNWRDMDLIEGGKLIGAQIFTANGTYTPTPGTKSIIVEAVGGGGGGGAAQANPGGQQSAGMGGGGASYGKARYTSGFTGLAVTIGAAGAGGTTTASNAGSGGLTSLGGILSVPGGVGGRPGATLPGTVIAQSPLDGSLAPSGANIESVAGSLPVQGLLIGTPLSGRGGDSRWGIGGIAIYGATAGVAGSGFGSGGSGGASGASVPLRNGGNGTPGKMIIWEYD